MANIFLNYGKVKPLIGVLCLVGLAAVISCLVKSKKKLPAKAKIDVALDHNVAPKQVINPHSPAQEEQLKFIAEGGNSQP